MIFVDIELVKPEGSVVESLVIVCFILVSHNSNNDQMYNYVGNAGCIDGIVDHHPSLDHDDHGLPLYHSYVLD